MNTWETLFSTTKSALKVQLPHLRLCQTKLKWTKYKTLQQKRNFPLWLRPNETNSRHNHSLTVGQRLQQSKTVLLKDTLMIHSHPCQGFPLWVFNLQLSCWLLLWPTKLLIIQSLLKSKMVISYCKAAKCKVRDICGHFSSPGRRCLLWAGLPRGTRWWISYQ